MGCNWTCSKCWSRYGWQGVLKTWREGADPSSGMGPRYELDPAQAATKLVEGMKRNAQTMCRLSGGEPTMHWDHTIAVIKEVVERTQGVRMHVPGMTDRRGDCMGIVIETNGSMLDAKRLDTLEKELGAEAARVVWSIGMKATHPEALSWLTGLPMPVAVRAHQKQLDALMHLALVSEHFVFFASFLDRCTDPGIYAALQREIERAKPGQGRVLNTQRLKNYGDSNVYGTPKRFRGRAFPDPSPEHDPELITELIDADGGIQTALQEVLAAEQALAAATDPEEIEDAQAALVDAQESVPSRDGPVPVSRPDDDPVLTLQLETAATIAEQGFAEGRVRT
jgi:uncharacterized Fe-S cluster-containing radical SAM superfamily protein